MLFFTICSINYLGTASILLDSLRSVYKDLRFVIYLADDIENLPKDINLDCEIFPATSLNIPNFFDMAFRYSILEFNTALKPFCFMHIFNQLGANRAVYLDPDIEVFARFSDVERELEAGANLVLTPHLTEPVFAPNSPDDIAIMRVGTFNLGFCAAANNGEVQKFMLWWSKRLSKDCLSDLEAGLFVDQKFMDLAPSYLSRVSILRNKGYNSAYWNLCQRAMEKRGDTFYSGGEKLVFFHYSGFNSSQPRRLSKHSDYEKSISDEVLRELCENYASKLSNSCQSKVSKVPYSYGEFTDGTPIVLAMRRAYARSFEPRAISRETCFAMDKNWFNEADSEFGGPLKGNLTRLMAEVWRSRLDLQSEFPLHLASSPKRFRDWFENNGAVESGVSVSHFVEPLIQNESGTLKAQIAKAILKFSQNLRGIYQYLPLKLRLRVKSALFRSAYKEPAPPAPLDKNKSVASNFHEGATIIGYLNSESGVGQSARNAVLALKAVDYEVSAISISGAQKFKENGADENIETVAASNNRTHIFHINADETGILEMKLPLDQLLNRYRIGVWAWELEKIPSAWADIATRLHEIWVPSNFVADAFATQLPARPLVMPHAIDCTKPSGYSREDFGIPSDRVIFLASFDMNSFFERKNPIATIRAFKLAFPENMANRPQLIMKTHSGITNSTKELNQLSAAINGDKDIIVIDKVLNNVQMRALIAIADAYVSLHRSEGFGLGLAEAMAFGVPVIATDYSGSTDFINSKNSMPIEYELIPVKMGSYVFSNGCRWAEPSIHKAAEAMKHLYNSAESRIKLGRLGAKTIEKGFSVAVIGKKMKERLNAINTIIEKSYLREF